MLLNLSVIQRNLRWSLQALSIVTGHDHFWDISRLIIDKIEGNPNYSLNKNKFNKFLIDNPYVAKKKGINTKIST